MGFYSDDEVLEKRTEYWGTCWRCNGEKVILVVRDYDASCIRDMPKTCPECGGSGLTVHVRFK